MQDINQKNQIIRGLYLGLLGREPDSSGLSNWIKIWQDDVSLEYIVNCFIDSDEYKNNISFTYQKEDKTTIIKSLDNGEVIESEIIVGIGGKNYIISSDDHYLNHIKNGFEPETLNLFTSLAVNSRVVLDIGANIGCTAIFLGDIVESVYAFEPSPTTFAFLEKNILNSGKNNIISQNFGLGAESTRTTLTFSPSNRSGGFVSNQIQVDRDHVTETITIKTLDEVIRLLDIQHIDFIKIDVEGFEKNVICGAMETILINKPVIVLELNHWCLNAFQRTSVPDFLDFLRSVFPILLAVDSSNYMDLHNEDDSYSIMYQHIINFRFPSIVAGFHQSQFEQFFDAYKHGFTP